MSMYDDSDVECGICGKSCAPWGLREHIKRKHGKLIKCPAGCGKTFVMFTDMHQHLNNSVRCDKLIIRR